MIISREGDPLLSAMTFPVSLAYRPPFEWAAMRNYLAARATPGLEAITHEGGDRYWRSVQVHGHGGFFAVGLAPGLPDTLGLDVSVSLRPALVPARELRDSGPGCGQHAVAAT